MGCSKAIPSASKRDENSSALVGQDAAHAVAVGERASHGVAQARGELLVGGDAQAVDDHRQLVGPDGGIEFRQQLLDETCAAVVLHALDAVAHERRQLLDDALPLGGDQRRCDERFRSLAEREDVLGHVVDVVALHLAARYGREGAADAGEEQFEVVVDLGGGADRRTRIARVDLLLDGDGRRDPRDEVDVGLVDLAQKLPGVGRQALHVAALPLGEDRVEGQGRFARAGEARDDGERVVRDFHLDVSEVVYPRSLDMDAFRFVHVSMVAPSTLRSRSVNRSARLARIRSTIDEIVEPLRLDGGLLLLDDAHDVVHRRVGEGHRDAAVDRSLHDACRRQYLRRRLLVCGDKARHAQFRPAEITHDDDQAVGRFV